MEKFGILKNHGLIISKNAVLKTLNNPDVVDFSRLPLKIAQRSFDKTRVLRVVYKEMDGSKTIITFYPGRKKRYDN